MILILILTLILGIDGLRRGLGLCGYEGVGV